MTTIELIKTDWQIYNIILWLFDNITNEWRTVEVLQDSTVYNKHQQFVNGHPKEVWKETILHLQKSFPAYLTDLPIMTKLSFARFEFDNTSDALLFKLRWG